MGLLEGKTAIVTGGAQGIGAAVVELMLEEGANVVIGDVRQQEGNALVERLGTQAARYVRLDVTDEDEWANAIAEAENAYGPVNVLVNNAGIVGSFGPFETTDRSVFEQVLQVNLVGTFLGIRAVIPSMRLAGGGSIVNMSSSVGMIGQGYVPAYVASKWGVRGLTKSAALELSREGIRVNSVHPGLTSTPMTEASDKDAETAGYPIPRPADPKEIARMFIFLASDQSSFSTGAEFLADGGAVAGHAGRPRQ
jgi:3alpha(or 20beta)-hydroxysteroid dehydrogenase